MATSAVKDLVCYCHWRGTLQFINGAYASCEGERIIVLLANANRQFEDFVYQACNALGIESSGKVFEFTTKHEPKCLVLMKDQQMFEMMLRLNDEYSHVFITESDVRVEDSGQEIGITSVRGSNGCNASQPSRTPPSVSQSIEANTGRGFKGSGCISPHLETREEHVYCESEISNHLGKECMPFCEGQLFDNPECFKAALSSYALVNKFAYQFMDNSRSYYRVCCKAKECEWKLTARCDGMSSVVRVIHVCNTHSHTLEDIANYMPTVRSSSIGVIVREKISEALNYPTRQICRDFQHDFGVPLTYKQGWRAKEWAKRNIIGDPRDSFKYVPWMCARLREWIPETRAEWIVNSEGHFQQLFVAYGPLIHGFAACRPLLFIDACHLKSHYAGVLMAATGLDANNGLYPLAYSFASAENDENWLWFLQQLHNVLDGRLVVLMTDRNPSLLNGIIHVFGGDCNSWCLRHLKENFSSFLRSKGINNKRREAALENLGQIAYARDERTMHKQLARMEKFGIQFKEWVLDNAPRHWTNALFPMKRWDWLSTNPAESFNAWMGEMRYMTIFQFMKAHVYKVTKFLNEKKEAVDKWSCPVGDRIVEKIKNNQERGFGCIPSTANANNGQYNVLASNRKYFAVDVVNKSCSCLEWQQSGLPCCHVMAILRTGAFDVYEFVDDWFRREKLEVMLEYMLPAVPTHDEPSLEDINCSAVSVPLAYEDIPTSLPLPPNIKRPRGRPKKKRIESQFQDRRGICCSRCRTFGHNRRNCKAAIPE